MMACTMTCWSCDSATLNGWFTRSPADLGDARHRKRRRGTGPRHNDPLEQVVSPWEGWREKRPGADTSKPYFGAGHPGVMWLNVRCVSRSITEKPGAIGMSVIQWIGNHYKMIGNAAKPETEKFWKRLRRFIASNSTRIPGAGAVDGPFPEIYAFKSALEEIQNGRARAANPDMG